jgi:hypothetical protein
MTIQNLNFFEEKEIRIRFIIYQQEESMSQSTIFPLVRENVHLLKENSGAQLDYVTRCIFTMAIGFDSPGVRHQFSETVCLGWQVYCLVASKR